jgi:arsenite/tail-anchored protein-transporting ATPase
MRLQDPSYTKLLIVTLPETTPVLEAEQLQADLRRAEIEPYAWVINQSLAAGSTTDPLLARRAQAELPQIESVQTEHSNTDVHRALDHVRARRYGCTGGICARGCSPGDG